MIILKEHQANKKMYWEESNNPLKKAIYFERFKGKVDCDEENNKKGEEEKNDDEKLEKLYESNKVSKKQMIWNPIRELFSKTKMK